MIDTEKNSNTLTVRPPCFTVCPASLVGTVAADIAEGGESADSEQFIALFSAEFGTKIADSFVNDRDNILNVRANNRLSVLPHQRNMFPNPVWLVPVLWAVSPNFARQIWGKSGEI